MNWTSLLTLAWNIALKPCLILFIIVCILCIIAARFTDIKKWIIATVGIFILGIGCLTVCGPRIYRYLPPRKNPKTEQTNYSKEFNDVQSTQIKAAKKYGIQPLKDRSAAEAFVKSGKLSKIKSGKNYHLDKMSHSIPYLTDNSAQLLNTIGQNFRDSLIRKGLCEHKIIVTSLLRTDADVERLQKQNAVAVKNSAHRHATTFDISYLRFVTVGLVNNATSNQLKKVLAEVLRDLRNEKLCYVKYEKSQGCFHITSRR